MRRDLLTAAFVVSALLSPSLAQELVPGRPAPALHVAKWLKGEPIAAFAAGRVYVVSFWASWSEEALAGMPELSRLQKQHAKDLTVLGMTTVDVANTLESVEQTVAAQGDKMAITLGWDDERKTLTAWMRASDMAGFPNCFVVDKQGQIAWMGHPQWLGEILPDVLAGKYELEALAGKITAVEDRLRRIFVAAVLEPETALKESAELLQQYPFLTEQVEAGMFELLLEGEGVAHAWPIGQRLVARAVAARDPYALNGIAWLIVDPDAERVSRNLPLALEAATKGVEFTEEKDADILDTLARVYAWQGEYARAIEVQKKAVAVAVTDEDEDMAEALRQTLAEYEAKLKKQGS